MAKSSDFLEKKLFGRELFYLYYVDMGTGASYKKISLQLYRNGVYNENTGKPFTPTGIYKAIWRWALMNLDEALPIVKEYELKFGVIRSDELWKRTIQKKIHLLCVWERAKFHRDHPEYETK